MSRDVPYIGMDVHKEAIVIAVQNSRGHLVIEVDPEPGAISAIKDIKGSRLRIALNR